MTQRVTYLGEEVGVLRLDLNHPLYGGNKIFKLKRNLDVALNGGFNRLLTFGGAHSNHIYSAAAFCGEKNMSSIGVIRGEERMIEESPTLQFALENGMKLHFVSREKYKDQNLVSELRDKFGNFYLVPEGGNNIEGVQGCMEIMSFAEKKYDYVFCACGTAATFSGIKISLQPETVAVGISVLKGENLLIQEANKWFAHFGSQPITAFSGSGIENSTILNDYHFGGYAKFSEDLISFKKEFEKQTGIPLDYVYTAKLFFAVSDLLKKKKLKENSSILIVHSGGLQGNAAFEKRYHLNASR